MTALRSLLDASSYLTQALSHVSTQGFLPAPEARQRLVDELSAAGSHPVEAIRDRADADAFAERFIRAARCVPELAQLIPPPGPEMFSLRWVYDPITAKDASPAHLDQWRTQARELVELANAIIQRLQSFAGNIEVGTSDQ